MAMKIYLNRYNDNGKPMVVAKDVTDSLASAFEVKTRKDLFNCLKDLFGQNIKSVFGNSFSIHTTKKQAEKAAAKKGARK